MDLMSSVQKIKSIVVVLLFALALFGQAAHATEPVEFAGAYAVDLVWSGTVTMTGDVLVQEGAKLTIRPGSIVNVIPAEGTKIDPEYLSSQTELLIRGQLVIQGTEESPVRFVVATGSDTEEYAWAGITLDHAGESRIAYAEIDHADIAIRCVESSPEIINNRITTCRYGIVAQLQSHPKILNNVLRDGEGGIFCWRGSNPYLKNNLITGHDEEAVFADAESRPWLDRNDIHQNSVGLALYARDLPYDLLNVTGNQEDIRWLGTQGQGGQ